MTSRGSAAAEITPEVLLRAYACGIFPGLQLLVLRRLRIIAAPSLYRRTGKTGRKAEHKPKRSLRTIAAGPVLPANPICSIELHLNGL
jgi:hypothetical protein